MTIEQTPIEDVIKELGLPENSEYMGYVIHLPETDEFLAKVKWDKHGSGSFMISKTPEIAKQYWNYKKALKDSERYGKNSKVCILFDAGDRYYAPPIGN